LSFSSKWFAREPLPHITLFFLPSRSKAITTRLWFAQMSQLRRVRELFEPFSTLLTAHFFERALISGLLPFLHCQDFSHEM